MLRTSKNMVAPVVIFDNVSKEFEIGKTPSLKQTVIGAFSGKEKHQKFKALDEVSFNVYPGEAVALIGKNGSGKSTALKLLSGVLRPDSGNVWTRGRVGGLLEVGAGFHPDLTGRENVYLNAAILGMSRKETDERFDEIVSFSEIEKFIDTEVKRYSSGMYARLGFSVAIHTQLDVLVVDEALSVGDADFRAKCNNKLKELQVQGKSMIIVSHSEGHIRTLCSRAILLQNGRVKFNGDIAKALSYMKNTKLASSDK